jgi:predicted XRE-type DNA-binding protein
MTYTNDELLKRINRARKNKTKLTHISDKSELSLEDRLKISFCKHFVQFANDQRMMIKDISKITGIPITRLSEITNYKISKFTVGQLIKNLSLLAEHDPKLQEYLLFIQEAADLPILKVKETRELTKKIAEKTKNAFVHA